MLAQYPRTQPLTRAAYGRFLGYRPAQSVVEEIPSNHQRNNKKIKKEKICHCHPPILPGAGSSKYEADQYLYVETQLCTLRKHLSVSKPNQRL